MENTTKSDRKYGRRSDKGRGRYDRSREKRMRFKNAPLQLPRDDDDLYGVPPPPLPAMVLLDRLEMADFHIVDIMIKEIFEEEFKQMLFRAREFIPTCIDCGEVLVTGRSEQCRSCYLDCYDW
jgi:hypothetical protein